jgi:hypothetical protein
MSLNRYIEEPKSNPTAEQPFDEVHITRGAVKQHILVQVVLRQTTLENVESFKYLGIGFESGGNLSHYMPARKNITHAYRTVRERSCGLA